MQCHGSYVRSSVIPRCSWDVGRALRLCSDSPMAGKKGPIYSVEWNPNSEEFCVVYGCILVLGVLG